MNFTKDKGYFLSVLCVKCFLWQAFCFAPIDMSSNTSHLAKTDGLFYNSGHGKWYKPGTD